jgi:hypothetical protein
MRYAAGKLGTFFTIPACSDAVLAQLVEQLIRNQ